MKHYCHYVTTIENVIKHFRYQNKIDKDDLHQELWLKVTEVMPTLEAVSEDEVCALAFVVLKNHVNDIFRKNKTRENINCMVEIGEISFNDFADSMMHKAGNKFLNSYNNLEHKDIVRILEAYYETVNPRIQHFFRELFNPSDATLEKWEVLKEEVRMYQQFDSIPPNTLGKFLGIPPVTVKKAMDELKHHFSCYGYKGKKYAH
jgi:DNA-directed RNA polymerase specialized sigma24 family protein